MLRNLPLLLVLLPLSASLFAAAPAAIPLTQGLTVTTALNEPGKGDYESTKTLEIRQGAGWLIRYRAIFPSRSSGRASQPFSSQRIQHDADLSRAGVYRARFEDNVDEDYPGTTALGASTQVLQQLKTTGSSPFRIIEDVSIFPSDADKNGALGLANLLTEGEAEFKGELKRTKSLTVPVIVNGHLQQLQAIAAQGEFVANGAGRVPATIIFLDNEQNPLALRWSIGKSSLSVVRIDWPKADAAAILSSELTQHKRISLPGLYFDFGSATLKPESAAALRTILTVLKKTSGPLRLEGHTDNIGPANANQALSLARVQAVKTALVKLEPGLASRLTTSGFGAGRPVADNASLEGRAQNRRVELVLSQ